MITNSKFRLSSLPGKSVRRRWRENWESQRTLCIPGGGLHGLEIRIPVPAYRRLKAPWLWIRKSEGVDIPSERIVYRMIQENRMKRYFPFPWPLTASTMPLFRIFIRSSDAPEAFKPSTFMTSVRPKISPSGNASRSFCMFPAVFGKKPAIIFGFAAPMSGFFVSMSVFLPRRTSNWYAMYGFGAGDAHPTKGCEERVPKTLSSHEFLF